VLTYSWRCWDTSRQVPVSIKAGVDCGGNDICNMPGWSPYPTARCLDSVYGTARAAAGSACLGNAVKCEMHIDRTSRDEPLRKTPSPRPQEAETY
jgi:hypothetical protein